MRLAEQVMNGKDKQDEHDTSSTTRLFQKTEALNNSPIGTTLTPLTMSRSVILFTN